MVSEKIYVIAGRVMMMMIMIVYAVCAIMIVYAVCAIMIVYAVCAIMIVYDDDDNDSLCVTPSPPTPPKQLNKLAPFSLSSSTLHLYFYKTFHY